MKYDDLIQISDPFIVYNKFKQIYPCESELRLSSRKDKKYMILNPKNGKWFHFGSTIQDYTKHKDTKRRDNFLRRNHKWKDADTYTPAYASYTLLW